ncbi:MAG: 4Fe-4S binding protein [Gemmiger sp.]|nr:4Fe-4S binding protein [Gemmiger sp.]
MLRKIIHIDQEKCNGCGLCANACHEGAIAMVGGKATLLRDDYCDGLGDCLPACAAGAITFVEREAAPYNEAAVPGNPHAPRPAHHASPAAAGEAGAETPPLPCGCPGSQARRLNPPAPQGAPCPGTPPGLTNLPQDTAPGYAPVPSQLGQWPVQIKLVPTSAAYFAGANLLVAADCAAYAYGDFHRRFIRGKVTLIGCPKLDGVDYTQKLTEILANNEIKSLTVVRMEVPCCGGLEHAAVTALKNSGKFIPWQVVTLTTDGNILE